MQMEIKRKLELQYSYQTKWNLIFKIMLFILFLAALSLHCSIGFTIVAAGEWWLVFIAVCGILTAVTFLVVEHGL